MATAINTEFLPLEYVRHHYGQPIEAQSEITPHQWNNHDGLEDTIEVSIEPSREETVNDYDTFYVWIKHVTRDTFNDSPYECVSWWQSPTFRRFIDAEAYAQFAYQRWQATGHLSSAAMEPRYDLNARRNPIY